MLIVSLGDNLQEESDPISRKNMKDIINLWLDMSLAWPAVVKLLGFFNYGSK